MRLLFRVGRTSENGVRQKREDVRLGHLHDEDVIDPGLSATHGAACVDSGNTEISQKLAGQESAGDIEEDLVVRAGRRDVRPSFHNLRRYLRLRQ